jgi:hypothetical protein
MLYFKREKPGGQWEEITGEEMMKVINAHFDIQPRRSWDGSEKPSRQQVADYIHNGDILNLYAADYKAQDETEDESWEAALAANDSPERIAATNARFQEIHNHVQEMKAEIKAARKQEKEQATQPPAYPMVEGEGAAQFTFDVPADTQLALF